MSPAEYLVERLRTCGISQEVIPQFVSDDARAAYIEQLIFRKPYRKWKAGDVLKERVPQAIAHTVSHHQPLTFRYWFGGYKLWRFKSAPRIDWAEFFSVAYYLEYLAPIAAAHPYGVVLQFCSDEYFVEQLNNIPQSDTQAYTQSFQELIALFRTYLPPSVSIEYSLNRNALGSEELFTSRFQEVVSQLRPGWESRRTPDELERDLASSWLNIRFDGGGSVDLSHLTYVQQREKALESLLLHDALGVFENPLIVDAHKDSSISIFAIAFPDSLGLGTTKNSMVKFWVGTGVLERVNDTFKERILSFRQYDEAKALARTHHDIGGAIPLFESVEVFDTPFDFQNKKVPML